MSKKNIKDGWQCSMCTLINKKCEKRCSSCFLYTIQTDYTVEYDRKLESYITRINPLFLELEIFDDAPFEFIVSDYLSHPLVNYDFNYFLKKNYVEDKDLSIVTSLVDNVHQPISIEDFNARYYERVLDINERISKLVKCSANDDNLNKPLQLSCINRRIIIPNEIKELTDDDIWNILTKTSVYSNSTKRMLMVELDLSFYDKLELLLACIKDAECGPYLKDSYESSIIKIIHIQDAIKQSMLIENVIKLLKRLCNICYGEFPAAEIKSVMACQDTHEFCNNCFHKSLNIDIREKTPWQWKCPSCTEESLLYFNKEMYHGEMLTFLQSNNKFLHELCNNKLRDQSLKANKKFHWCANSKCPNGFEADGVNSKIRCPSCSMFMCVNCNREWNEEHKNVTCLEYEMWILKNEPDRTKVLSEIGIECPQCHMFYALAPGGCLHFICRECGWVFCGGCYTEFTKNCKIADCKMKSSLHGHHPRNCLFYLRDYDINDLKTMLEDRDYPEHEDTSSAKCSLLITIADSLETKTCNQDVHQTSGLCATHYKEYLVQFINRFKIDPADYLGSSRLKIVLSQSFQEVLELEDLETDDNFVIRLRNEIKSTCPFYVPRGL